MSSRSHFGNLYLQGDIDFDRDHPIGDGGFGELFAGHNEANGNVALKRLRIRGTGEDRQRYVDETLAEARVWRTLIHPNVLPFLGILFENREIYMISPLVPLGSLPNYLTTNPSADRTTLLTEVAQGLSYLHTQNIIHGDVKGTNVLVHSRPRAALCDFGLSKIITPDPTSTKGGMGTVRWQSPELMEGGPRSFEGDVYAFGMTVYEIVSGKVPFHEVVQDSAVIIAVLIRDERPSLHEAFADRYTTLRETAQQCWQKLPASRPSMTEVLRLLGSTPTPKHEALQMEESTLRSDSPASDGSRLNSSSTSSSFPMWDATSGEEVTILRGHANGIRSVAFSPDGSQLASASTDSTIRVWDVLTGAESILFKGHSTEWIFTVAFSPDGTRLASGSSHNVVRVWNVRSKSEVGTLMGHNGFVWSVSFSPDGLLVASGSKDKMVRVWDVKTRKTVVTCRGHTGDVTSVVFSADGSRLASGSGDSTVCLWDVVSGAELMKLQGHAGWVWSVALSPDGLRLGSGANDKTVRIWDVVSGECLQTLQGHTGHIWSVKFLPDGSQIASSSSDSTVKIWDTASGVEVVTLTGHTDEVTSVAFSQDGSRLASGSSDSTVRVWQQAVQL